MAERTVVLQVTCHAAPGTPDDELAAAVAGLVEATGVVHQVVEVYAVPDSGPPPQRPRLRLAPWPLSRGEQSERP